MSILQFADQITKFRIADFQVQYFHPTIPLVGFGLREVFDLSQLANSIDWGDDIDSASLQCVVRFNYHEKLKDIVGVGGIITVFGYSLTTGGISFEELFRVVVIDTDVKTDKSGSSEFIATCLDHMFYTVNNDHTVKFPAGNTASGIIKTLCADFLIPVGTIEDTGAVLGRLIFRKESIYDMMITALSESRYIDGQRYIIRMEKGALNVRRQTNSKQIFVLSYGENIYSAGLRKSISKLRTRVTLYGTQTGNDLLGIVDQNNSQVEGAVEENDTITLLAQKDDDFMMKYYGLLQHIETGVSPENITDIEAYAEHLLSTLNKVDWVGSVSAPNINNIRWGDPIYIYEPITGMVGQFYVMASRHIVDTEGARMELQVHYEARLPEILFEKFENTGQQAANPLTEIIDNNNLGPQNMEYVTPLSGDYKITQEYGANPHTKFNPTAYGHTGIDMAHRVSPIGMSIRAVNDGEIESAGVDRLGGNMVIIDHLDGYRSLYAHLNTIYAKQGTTIKKGASIGTVGQSGSAMPGPENLAGGPHLHFQMMRGKTIISPRDIVPGIHRKT